ncbi:DegV family protein [Arenicella xantha]|uniref:Fatty acid-binding protein DegV n=1 Tax=Arenicella xantha TaxID=644221 RepID=A0A395JL71_9GAMM|nr:DegV family protein [Arenicella xantha]RBP51175.1 fatty acid-binding protein DegV [Arenicella xantha]
MKYTIIIDSIAGIPNHVLESRPFKVMPVTVELDGKIMPDTFDEKTLIDFYQGDSLNIKSQVSSSAPSEDDISNLIAREVAPYSDYAFCQTVSRQVSDTYDNFEQAASHITSRVRAIRDRMNIEHPFRMSCVNTGTTIAGQGLIAIYADMLLSKGADMAEYTKTMNKLVKLVHCYPVVADIYYSRERGLERGVKTVSLPAAVLGKTVGLNPIVQIKYDHIAKPVLTKRGLPNSIGHLFKHAAAMIEEGLYVPLINLSYAGDPRELETFEHYDLMMSTAKKHKITVLKGVMSLAASVVYGPGAFALGIAPKNQKALPA